MALSLFIIACVLAPFVAQRALRGTHDGANVKTLMPDASLATVARIMVVFPVPRLAAQSGHDVARIKDDERR